MNFFPYFLPGRSPRQVWELSDVGAGRLMRGCNLTFLDCTDPSDANRTLFPDLDQPLRYPGVRCLPGYPGLLRVYYGSGCGIWNPDNAARCWWCVSA